METSSSRPVSTEDAQSHLLSSDSTTLKSAAATSNSEFAVNDRHVEEDNPLVKIPKERWLPPQEAIVKKAGIRTMLQWWLPEILVSLCSVVMLLIIASVLYHYNDRAQSDLHLPAGLTLNGLVALLSTITRALLMVPVGSAMMQELWLHFAAEINRPICCSQLRDMEIFDAASRGAWGSLAFLYHAGYFVLRRRRRRALAVLGALITILSLGFGTLTQQLIAYDELKLSSSSRPGYLPHTESWDRCVKTYLVSANGNGLVYTAPVEMTGALYSGSLGRDVAPIPGNCPSGNCTWPVTPSLAICGACTKVQYRIGPSYTDGLPFRNYTLPSGLRTPLYDFASDSTGKCLDCDVGYVFKVVNDRGINFNDPLVPYLARFSLVGAPQGFRDLPNLASHVTAAECALWMCVQAYNTTVRASQTMQDVIATSHHADQLYEMETNGNSTYRPIRRISVPTEATSCGVNRTFKVSADAFEGMENYFGRALLGSVAMTETTQRFSNDLIYGAWNGSKDADGWINDIATSLTNVIRKAGTTNATIYEGASFEFGLTIRWNWLILPAALILASIIFLIAVMVKTERSSIYPWKGSPLTFLLFELDESIRQASFGKYSQYGGFEKAVGRSRVRLVADSERTLKFKAI